MVLRSQARVTRALAAGALAFAACDPQAVFVDPSGLACNAVDEACPGGWRCGPQQTCVSTDAGVSDAGTSTSSTSTSSGASTAGASSTSATTSAATSSTSSGTGASASGGTTSGSATGGGACVIAGQTYAAGATDPSNDCLLCDTANTPSAWSDAPEGTACASGFCLAGHCGVTCVLDAGTVDAGASDPAAPCLSCVPSRSRSHWSPLTDGTTCGTSGWFCLGGSCVSGCDVNGVIADAGGRAPRSVLLTK